MKILENRGTRVLAAVISPAFEAMDKYDRQTLVWGKLLDDLGDEDSRRVEFVYTATPGELEASVAGAKAQQP